MEPEPDPEPEPEKNLLKLPETCIWTILSFTTPGDVCRLSAVCKFFRSAAYDDSLWRKFIPQYYEQLSSIEFSSKRELYFRLCDSILIDGGRKIFWLERSTAKIGYMFSAREFDIVWSNNQNYWRWVSRQDSRFEEVAELLKVCWLEIRGGVDCRLLSSDTEYRVLFLLKFGERSNGWNSLPIHFSVKTPGGEKIESEYIFLGSQGERLRINSRGWMEVVVGEFTVTAAHHDSSRIEFEMKEVQSNWWKRGLVFEGVRVEPKYN